MFGFAVLAFLALGFWRYRVNHIPGVWTTEKEALYRYGIQHVHDPIRLAEMADHFEQDGFQDRATIFRERAKLVHVHGEAQTKFGMVMRKALSSQNPDTVRAIANRYERSGRGASAEMLRSYANGLETSKQISPGFGYGNVLGSGANFGYGNVLGSGANFGGINFGIGTIIPSTYIPPGSQKPKEQASDEQSSDDHSNAPTENNPS